MLYELVEAAVLDGSGLKLALKRRALLAQLLGSRGVTPGCMTCININAAQNASTSTRIILDS